MTTQIQTIGDKYEEERFQLQRIHYKQLREKGKNTKTVEHSQLEVMPEGEKVRKPKSVKPKEHYCHFCDNFHPVGSHTMSHPDARKGSLLDGHGQTWCMVVASCWFCNKPNESNTKCGACGISGESMHCFSHWREFILSNQDDRLQLERMYDSCTICLKRNHSKASHDDAGKPLRCGVYNRANGSHCYSRENAAFYGSSSRKQETQPGATTENKEHKNLLDKREVDRPRSIQFREQLKNPQSVICRSLPCQTQPDLAKSSLCISVKIGLAQQTILCPAIFSFLHRSSLSILCRLCMCNAASDSWCTR
jgi:hypothetical protein